MANTTETVTVRLIVAADGALKSLDQFDKGMLDAANASVKAGAGVDAFTAHLARQRSAMEAGIPVMKARAAAVTAEQRVLQNALGRAEPLYKAQIAAERDLSRAVAASSNLVIQGKMREEDAIKQVIAIEKAHVASINRVIAAERQAAEAAQASSASTLNSANAVQAYNQSASRNAAESANIAMQFQDIAVSAQMGMNPMMIAMQQGTQISAVLNQMKNPLRALPAAFMAIINPVSLLTIGLVGLSAVGVQWFASLFEGAEETEDALQAHLDMLDKLLIGYDKARDAAGKFIEASQQRAEGAVASDLEAQRKAALTELNGELDKIAVKQQLITDDLSNLRLGGDLFADLIAAADPLDDLRFSASMTREEFDRLETQLTQVANSDAPDQARGYASDLLQLLNTVKRLTGEVGSFGAALDALPRNVQIKLSMSQEFGSAMSGLGDLYIDPRNRFDIMREEAKNFADQASVSANSLGEAAGAGAEYQRVLESINAAEAEANAKAGKRGGRGKESPMDKWGDDVAAFKERIAQQEMEASLLGQSTFEIERQRAAFDLLNQAKAAGLTITPDLNNQVDQMATAYATATVELERMAEAQRLQEEMMNFYKGTLSSFVSDFTQGLRNGESVWESFGNAAVSALNSIADRLMSMATDGLFDMLFGAFMGGIGGNFMGGTAGAPALKLGFQTGVPGFADGTNFAPGGMAWVGERGPELLNLPRGSQVIPHQKSVAIAKNSGGQSKAVTNNITINGSNLSQAEMQAAIEDALDHYDRFKAPTTFHRIQDDPTARG